MEGRREGTVPPRYVHRFLSNICFALQHSWRSLLPIKTRNQKQRLFITLFYVFWRAARSTFIMPQLIFTILCGCSVKDGESLFSRASAARSGTKKTKHPNKKRDLAAAVWEPSITFSLRARPNLRYLRVTLSGCHQPRGVTLRGNTRKVSPLDMPPIFMMLCLGEACSLI